MSQSASGPNKGKPVNELNQVKMSPSERATLATGKLKDKILNYDPYAVFNDRRGCIFAVGVSILLIIVFILNAFMNGNWISLVFVPIYLYIIRNRLRRLRELADD